MITFNNIEEVNKLIKDGVLNVNDDIEIAFDGFDIKADIKCRNIYSEGYLRDLSAHDISAHDISVNNISANNILANDISYYAVCFAYKNITCKSIKGRRDNSKHFSLDGKVTINGKVEKK